MDFRQATLFVFICFAVAGCDAKKLNVVHDTTINGMIRLRNSSSVQTYFGDVMPKLDSSKDLPDVYFKNQSGSEYLRLIFYPGDNTNEFSVFEVTKANAAQKALPTYFTHFATESGVKLGMSPVQILERCGKDYTKTKSGETITLRYEIDESKDSDFLRRYNMPLYFAEYVFRNGTLEKYQIGFESP